MADNDGVPGSPDRDADAAESPAPAAPDEPTVADPVIPPERAPAPVLKTRWRDRAWSFRSMLAVALATFLIGGIAGGIVVGATGDDHDGQHRMGRWGPGGPMGGPGWRWRDPRGYNGDGGPQWRWNDGPVPPPNLTPYGGTTPAPKPATPTP
jgi:hypothetical protein